MAAKKKLQGEKATPVKKLSDIELDGEVETTPPAGYEHESGAEEQTANTPAGYYAG